MRLRKWGMTYDTRTARLLWTAECRGAAMELYRGRNGAYFSVRYDQGKRPVLRPLTMPEAWYLYNVGSEGDRVTRQAAPEHEAFSMHPHLDTIQVGGASYRIADEVDELTCDRYLVGKHIQHTTDGREHILCRIRATGQYVVLTLTDWDNEQDTYETVTEAEAMAVYSDMPEHLCNWSYAFPGR